MAKTACAFSEIDTEFVDGRAVTEAGAVVAEREWFAVVRGSAGVAPVIELVRSPAIGIVL